MTRHFLKSLLSGILLACPLYAAAEDIDLFANPSTGGKVPNILLIIDNGANFSANVSDQVCRISATGQVAVTSDGLVVNPTITDPTHPDYPERIDSSNNTALNGTAAAVEQCALYNVIKGLDTASGVKVNIGVMVFNTNGMKAVDTATGLLTAECVGSDGGCLIYPIVSLTAAAQTRLLTWIKGWKTSGGSGAVGDDISSGHNIKGNNTSNGAAMQEAWAYFKGKTGLSGRDYSSILPTSECMYDYVVFIGNAYRNNSSPGDSTGDAGPRNALSGTNSVALTNANPPATAAQKTVFRDTITTTCGTNTLESAEGKGAYAVNWALYMNQQHKITTFSVGILGPTCNSEYAAHLSKMGQTEIGNGKYFGTSSFDELNKGLKTILGEIQSVNSVFASVSLPVSVNTQGTYLNQVYIGMFRPDASVGPRWAGNLKQYKLGLDNNDLKLLDADGTRAINSTTGFVTECARSFWTPTTADTYWSAGSVLQKGACTAIENALNSNYPDGNVVEKGAQAYVLRGITPTSRVVKTCSPVFATCSATAALTSFDTSNNAIAWDKLGLASSTATNPSAANLIDWARGTNLLGELGKGTTVMRPSSHGDVVHSRPVAVNYGTDGAPKVVVYYGTNDGMLRAINGNRDTNANGTPGNITFGGSTYVPGAELWSFMPPEFYSNIKRLYQNAPTIKLKTTSMPGEMPKPYGFDGPITAYSSADATWLYTTMRRGARALYAFDATAPQSPTLKWKKGCPGNFPESGAASDTDCTPGFEGIGQTWSAAKTIFSLGYESGTVPMLIMGGGYDTCEDTDDGAANHACVHASTKGNKIYVLDAADGTVLNTIEDFTTARSVVGDVTVVRDNATGMIEYAYATDLGGNVYRISGAAGAKIGSTDPADWVMTRIASLGCDTAPTTIDAALPCSANRKFMFAPDVVFDNGMYILLIGSGDREKPLSNYEASYGVANHFFMLKDKPTDANWLSSEAHVTLCGSAVICKASLIGIANDGASPAQSDVDNVKGWYLQLAAGEQVVTTSVTIFGVVSFSTHQPATAETASCNSNLGKAQVYNIAYTDAASTNEPGADGVIRRYEDLRGNGLPPSPVAGQVTLDDEDGGLTVPFCIGCSATSPLEGKLKIKPPSNMGGLYKSRVYWYTRQ